MVKKLPKIPDFSEKIGNRDFLLKKTSGIPDSGIGSARSLKWILGRYQKIKSLRSLFLVEY